MIDRDESRTAEAPSFLAADETLTGFAYDPFTDHFFLRLAPGNRVRVVDRPARSIKREFTVATLPASGGGDIAVRPRDGHLFFLHPLRPIVIETSRLGKPVREIVLANMKAAARGIALDSRTNRLLVLHADGRAVSLHGTDGRRLDEMTLDQPVAPSIAIDSERSHLYAPLASESGTLGVFDLEGKLLRRLEAGNAEFVEVGPRSFIRVF